MMSTSHTTAIKFCNDNATIYVIIGIIFRFGWVDGYVCSTHIGVARHIVCFIIVTVCE